MKITMTRDQIVKEMPVFIAKVQDKAKDISAFWTQTIKIVLTLATTSLYGSVPLFQFFYKGKENAEGSSYWCWGWLCLLVSIVLLVWGFIEQARHSVMVLNEDQKHIKILTEAFWEQKEAVNIEISSIILYMRLYFSILGLICFVLGMGFLMIGAVGGSFPEYFSTIKYLVFTGEIVFLAWAGYSYRKFDKSQKEGKF